MQKTSLRSVCFVVGLMGIAPVFGTEQGEIGKLLEQRLGGEISSQAQQEQVVLAKQARMAAIAEGEQVLQSSEELKTAIQAWESKIKSLLTSADGKGIASDPTSVKRFISVYQTERMQIDQVQAIGRQITELLKPIQTPSNPLYTPSETLVAEIHKQGDAVKAELKNYARLQTQLSFLLRSSHGVTSSGSTLKEVMDIYLEEEARQEFEYRDKVRQGAQERAREQIREQYAKLLPSIEENTYLREQAARPDV